MIYNNCLLYFNNSLFLPDPDEFVRAYLDEKLNVVKKINSYEHIFDADKENIAILEYFKIKDSVKKENINLFLKALSEFVDKNLDIRNEILPKEVSNFLYNFIDLIDDNLERNYINLKYSKKIFRAKYKINYFLEYLELDSYFKEKIKRLEFRYNLKIAIYYVISLLMIFLFYFVLETSRNFLGIFIAGLIGITGFLFIMEFSIYEK